MNIRSLFITVLLVGGSASFLAPGASAQADDSHPGAAVYQSSCAVCHGGGNARAPRLGILQAMSADDLTYALSQGLMAAEGSALSAQDRATVIEYLAAPEVTHEAWIADIMCAADRRLVDLTGPAAMRTVGVEITATRMISAEASGLSKGDMENLELAWALAFPGVTRLRAAPVIVGSTVFYSAVNTRKLLALDAETGCIKWVYDSPTPLRSSVSIAELGDNGRQ
ncbi:MAG: c-type cytochrome, partial [Gemmatimonadetes bacterium]|nr:c-type cytochrome [Gemmatimonadota bacterium]